MNRDIKGVRARRAHLIKWHEEKRLPLEMKREEKKGSGMGSESEWERKQAEKNYLI